MSAAIMMWMICKSSLDQNQTGPSTGGNSEASDAWETVPIDGGCGGTVKSAGTSSSRTRSCHARVPIGGGGGRNVRSAATSNCR
eukprot:2223209-Pyramimonas_sp.AAC.1